MADRRASRPRPWATVRFRITAVAVGAVLLVMAGAATAVVVVQRRVLMENLEESVSEAADTVLRAESSTELPDVLGGYGDDDTVVQVVRPDGAVIAATRNVLGKPPIVTSPRAARVWRSVGELPHDDAPYRVLSVRASDGTVVHVAGARDDVDESTVVLAVSFAVAIPVVTALLGLVVWWLVGRTLRPVEAIRSSVEGIEGSALERRVPEPAGDDEIARLARTMNAMLARIEDAIARQRRFVADASHELRGPLARIRSELEVDIVHPQTADHVATHQSVLEETIALQHLVTDLLHLARADAGRGPARRELVDLDHVVSRVVQGLRDGGRVTVDASRVSAAQVIGDAGELTRAVTNLTDNAARHAATTVTIDLAEADGEAVLVVADDGPGIPADERERIFERFARIDDARTPHTGGTGLGLAIARDIALRHGGSLRLDDGAARGARFVLRLPLSD